jgi:hypothetical protein
MNHIKRISLRSALLLAAIGTSASVWAAVNVDLEVQNQNGTNVLVVTKNNSQCADGPIDCIEIKPGSQPHLFFSMQGACTGTDYRLTKFRIAERNKQWPTPGNPLNAQTASDFCADPGTGYVNFMTCDNDLRDGMMKLKDFNRTPTTVYYEITAENCMDANEEIYLDPRIENKGTN